MQERRRFRRIRTRAARRLKTRLFYRKLMIAQAHNIVAGLQFQSEAEFISRDLLALTNGAREWRALAANEKTA